MPVGSADRFVALLRKGGRGPAVREALVGLLQRNPCLLIPALIAELEAASDRDPAVAENVLEAWLGKGPRHADLLLLVATLPEGRMASHQQRLELWKRLETACVSRARSRPSVLHLVRLGLADALRKEGRLVDAETVAVKVLQEIGQANRHALTSRRQAAFGFAILTGIFLEQGRITEAVEASRAAARILPSRSRTAGALAANQVVLNSIATTLLEAGDSAGALEILSRASEECLRPALSKTTDAYQVLKYQLRLADAWHQLGQRARAHPLASRAWAYSRKVFSRNPDRHLVPFLLAAGILSQLLQEAGRVERAFTIRTEALTKLRSLVGFTGNRHLRAYLEELAGYGEFCLEIERPGAALETAKAGVDALPKLEAFEGRRDPTLRGMVWTVLAEAARSLGDPVMARSAAAKAIKSLSSPKQAYRGDAILLHRAKAAARCPKS